MDRTSRDILIDAVVAGGDAGCVSGDFVVVTCSSSTRSEAAVVVGGEYLRKIIGTFTLSLALYWAKTVFLPNLFKLVPLLPIAKGSGYSTANGCSMYRKPLNPQA